MKYFLETRLLPSDLWSRLSGDHEVGQAFNTSRRLASTGLEVRIFDENGNQVFQHRKVPGQAGSATANAAVKAKRNSA